MTIYRLGFGASFLSYCHVLLILCFLNFPPSLSRPSLPPPDTPLLPLHSPYVIQPPFLVTEIWLSRMALAPAAILEYQFCARSPRFTLWHFTFSLNDNKKIILKLPDTYATERSIWNFTAFNSVHTEKWEPKTCPRYITFPKHAWQDNFHGYVHNAVYKLIVHFTQRRYHYSSFIQYTQYSSVNGYVCRGYVFFVELLSRWR